MVTADDRIYIVTDVDGSLDEATPFCLSDLVRCDELCAIDPEDYDAMRALEEGGEHIIDIGAGGQTTVRRVPRSELPGWLDRIESDREAQDAAELACADGWR
jgi:hypothetical protein